MIEEEGSNQPSIIENEIEESKNKTENTQSELLTADNFLKKKPEFFVFSKKVVSTAARLPHKN